MNVETLRAIINNPTVTASARAAAMEKLRELQAGRGEQPGTSEATAPVGGSLEAELLFKAGAQSLGDVEYEDIQSFCVTERWSDEAWSLYHKWVGANKHALGSVLKAYLALHFGARSTAKHLISNSGKGWPYHSCNKEAVKAFLEAEPGCKDAETVCREFLEAGHITKLPEECECWRFTRAIERADREKNPLVLTDELSQLPETHLAAECARNDE
jgi:hypothetical protein